MPDEWIIIDDGEDSQTYDILKEISLPNCKLFYPPKKWKLGDNTQASNMLQGLEACSGDIIAVIEDDDYYAPTYLETMLKELIKKQVLAIGESNSRYYNLKHYRFKLYRNVSYAPLCQTLFRRELLPTVIEVFRDYESRFDAILWKKLTAPRYLFPQTTLTVGMKGLPGRPGLGRGHNASDPDWQNDNANLDQLFKWVGDDAQAYRDL